MYKKVFLIVLLLIIVTIVSYLFFRFMNKKDGTIQPTKKSEIPRPLLKYTIDNLAKTQIVDTKLTINEMITEETDYTSYLFTLEFDPNLDGKEPKVTTGQINIPKATNKNEFPLILMIRGYVDEEIYKTGIGTRNASAYFATNGFITIAPDFLGYGGSSDNMENIFESRFQTYTTMLALVNSIDQLKKPIGSTNVKWDGKNTFIWAHSNGGQIALTVLEVTGDKYPTTLWAPVTAPFPYSVLFYTIDSVDGGKFIRRELAEFERLYDTDLFSLRNYLDRIKAPIQIHQGTLDDAVPYEWNKSFSQILEDKGVEVSYYQYAADHNMRPAWDEVVVRDLVFFRKYLNFK